MNAKYIGFDIDSKKNDRIDARKQAVLLGIGEVPPVHIPGGGRTAEAILALKNRSSSAGTRVRKWRSSRRPASC